MLLAARTPAARTGGPHATAASTSRTGPRGAVVRAASASARRRSSGRLARQAGPQAVARPQEHQAPEQGPAATPVVVEVADEDIDGHMTTAGYGGVAARAAKGKKPGEEGEADGTRAPTPAGTAGASSSSSSSSGSWISKEAKAAVVSLGSSLGGLGVLLGLWYIFREDINWALKAFADHLDGQGALGALEFGAVYAALEMIAVPAIPLTLSAGALFGVAKGTAIVSAAATSAATGAFLLSRYVARRRVAEIASKYPKFAAIDAAIGRDGFRVVLLLRLSPLLPFAISNYLYGLTSVRLGPYVLASWLGMLPGTFLYISAGSLSRAALDGAPPGADAAGTSWMSYGGLAAGLVLSMVAAAYVTRLVSKTLEEAESNGSKKEEDGPSSVDP